MSYQNGWAAICHEDSDKVARTEYLIGENTPLAERVTGISPRDAASEEAMWSEFVRCWDFGFNWNVMVTAAHINEAGGKTTSMGHAAYKADGSDFNAHIEQAFESIEDAARLRPSRDFRFFERADLLERFECNYHNQQRLYPDTVAMSGVYVTLFSGLIDIYGFEQLLLLMGLHLDELNEVIESYAEWMLPFFEAYAQSSIPAIMVHDDICWTEGPVTHPAWYRENIFPHYKKLLAPLKAAGKKILFTSDGTIDDFFGDFVDLGIDTLVMEPTCNIREFGRLYGDRCGMVGGIDCRALASASRDEIERLVRETLEWGKRYNGYIFACGNHLPPSVPVEKAIFYNEMYERYSGK